ncbi:hypothetical protein H072_2461 [Dactylellina haptotyla CBS 200.50]|uniref:Apple domain-containing protein n=1 Tax=Dactylellina haptotyla (strain CBS 200.50) TaxID=1284197 RepID=S8AKZ0_DACHA|nr:hypothetical protein H072_2461 [Dactylellina haptotyla CBS 200.50]
MPSFTQIVIVSIAALAASVSAGPVAARDVNICWGPKSNGTDAYNYPTPARCLNSWNEDAFTAPFALIGASGSSIGVTTETHQTFGPWHCCNSCKPADNCIGWQINANCDCILWKAATTDGAADVFGVYGGPFQNQSGTFHRGPAFPVKPNFFGNSVTN